jgi:hypothetical protein
MIHRYSITIAEMCNIQVHEIANEFYQAECDLHFRGNKTNSSFSNLFSNDHIIKNIKEKMAKKNRFREKCKTVIWTLEVLKANIKEKDGSKKKIISVDVYGNQRQDLLMFGLQGMGFGTIIWRHFAIWLQNTYPAADEFKLDLAPTDAENKHNRIRKKYNV